MMSDQPQGAVDYYDFASAVDYSDCYDFAGQDGFREIDIAAELQCVASEGVAVVVGADECLRLQLTYTNHTFMDFMTTVVHWPGDGLELRSAVALREVDELLRQQTAQEAPALPPAAVKQLQLLQRHAQDVVVLVHSRYIAHKILQGRGTPTELLLRLEASFGTGLRNDAALWSRLGNSKHHVFARGLQFRHQKGHRGGGGVRRAADAAALPLVVSSAALATGNFQAGEMGTTIGISQVMNRPSTMEDFDEPLHIHLLELVGTERSKEARDTGASSSSADGGEPLHIHWLEWKIELALKRHGVTASRELIGDIVTTFRALIDG